MKKKVIISLIVIILIIAIIVTIVIATSKPKIKPEDTFLKYVESISSQNYEEMYAMLTKASQEKISKEDFVKRNKNIYEGIEVANFGINITSVNKVDDNNTDVIYANNMSTMAGELHFSNTVRIVKEAEDTYKIKWSSNLIFPNLNDTDKVRVSTLTAKRGNILDRNDKKLATDGIASEIGLVPGRMRETKEQDIAKVAKLLNMTAEGIQKSLSASYVKEDTFVPLKTIAKEEVSLKNALLEIKGIKIVDDEERVYPLGEATSQLIGYVQSIGAEELKEKASDGYTSSSIIGKYGLERIYESTLKATNGSEIYIEDSNGKKKQTVLKQDKKDGTDLKLTIDSTIQSELYEQFKTDKSAAVAMNPKTGELLALVSCPTFNSNAFSLGMTTADYNALVNNPENPMFNRYLATYAPGSSFKPVTGAIGLETGSFTKEEDFGKSGTKWQNSSSWGDFFITTLTTYSGVANLENALIHSDNIYFAKAALKTGKEKFISSLKGLGFGEKINFVQDITKSSFSNTEGFSTETVLANSGYGQGEMLVNPIHMAMLYSCFTNEGNMIMPYIEYKEGASSKNATYYKEKAFSKEVANTIKEDLIQVVENPKGTAHDAKITGQTIAGKTGTAEIKASKEDTEGTEVGWFNAFNITESDKDSLLIISMVENVKGKGGSHYLLPKVKAVF